MKKALLLLIAVISVFQAFAQEADSTVVSQAAPADSISLKLDKLQHDFNYMLCEFEQYKMITELKLLANSIGNSSNSLVTYVYNSRFDRDLYESYLTTYDSSRDLLNALKEYVDVVKLIVLAKMMQTDFSEAEQNMINARFETIRKSVVATERELNKLDAALKVYKKLR